MPFERASVNLDLALLFLSFVATYTLIQNPLRRSVSGHRVSAMSKLSQQQDLSVLSTAKNGLIYLTSNDWALIADKAVRTTVQGRGSSLCIRASKRFGVFILLKGTARCRYPSQTSSLTINPASAAERYPFWTNCRPRQMWSRSSDGRGLLPGSARLFCHCSNFFLIWDPAFTSRWLPSSRGG